jgi:hypothetical protein
MALTGDIIKGEVKVQSVLWFVDKILLELQIVEIEQEEMERLPLIQG